MALSLTPGVLCCSLALASVPGEPLLQCPLVSVVGDANATILVDPLFFNFQGCQCQLGYSMRRRDNQVRHLNLSKAYIVRLYATWASAVHRPAHH